MNWSMPISRSEIRSARRRQAKNSCVLSSVGPQHWLGFHEALSGRVYAGALLVGMVKHDAIVFHPVSDDAAWVCAIVDGMPVVEFDKVLPLTEARDIAGEWGALFPKAEWLGDIAGAQLSLKNVFDLLDEGLKAKTIHKKQVDATLLRHAHFSPVRVGKVVLKSGAILGLAYGAFLYVQDLRKQTLAEQAARDAQIQAAAKAKIQGEQEAAQRARLAAFQAQVDAVRAQYLERTSLAGLWDAFSDVRRSLPLSLYGYKPQAIECTIEQCRVNWAGAGRLTSVAAKLYLPQVEPNLTPDLLATSVFPHELDQEALPPSQMRSGDDARFLIQSFFALHVKSLRVNAAQPITVAPPAALKSIPETVAQVGTWQIQVQGNTALMDAQAVLDMVAQWPMRLTGIRYQPGARTFELSGDYVFLSASKG